MTTVHLNEKVPHFSGKTNIGAFDLSEYQGKNLVIYFYPKDSTPGCTIESRAFRDYILDFKNCNTEIVGVSRDSIKSHCNFVEKHGLNFPLISDDDESICKLFDVLKEKSMFGKKYFGIVRSTFLIDAQGVLRQEWRDVSVMGHVKEVLKCAQDLK